MAEEVIYRTSNCFLYKYQINGVLVLRRALFGMELFGWVLCKVFQHWGRSEVITIHLTEPVYPVQQVSSTIGVNKPEGSCMKEKYALQSS